MQLAREAISPDCTQQLGGESRSPLIEVGQPPALARALPRHLDQELGDGPRAEPVQMLGAAAQAQAIYSGSIEPLAVPHMGDW